MRAWYKMDADIFRSRKVRTLSLEEIGFWALVLGVAKFGDGILPGVEELAWELRIEGEDVGRLVSALVSKGFLLPLANGGFTPNDWADYQVSTSAERMAAKRARDRVTKDGDVTERDGECVTGPELVTLRQDKTREEERREETRGLRLLPPDPNPRQILPADLLAGFEEFIAAYPNQVKTEMACQTWLSLAEVRKISAVLIPEIMAGLGRWKESRQWEDQGGRFIPAPHVFLRDELWRDNPPKGDAVKSKELIPEWTPPKKRRDLEVA